MEQLPKEPTPEQLDQEIERLLQELDNNYGELWHDLTPEMQDRWYDAEMEAKVGKDRQAAKTHLQEFLAVLEKIKQKPKS